MEHEHKTNQQIIYHNKLTELQQMTTQPTISAGRPENEDRGGEWMGGEWTDAQECGGNDDERTRKRGNDNGHERTGERGNDNDHEQTGERWNKDNIVKAWE